MTAINDMVTRLKETFSERSKKTAAILRRAGLSKELIEKELRLQIGKPEPFPRGIPTLEQGVYRSPSRMISSRFSCCGSIRDMSEKWLSISEMEKIWGSKKMLREIESHKKHWLDSAPARYPKERLSLFGIVVGEAENQTFLVWPLKKGLEPEIWRYSGQNEQKFHDIEEFLDWFTAS